MNKAIIDETKSDKTRYIAGKSNYLKNRECIWSDDQPEKITTTFVSEVMG